MSDTLPSPPYWRVPLTGHRFDLEDVRDAMRSPDLAIVTDGDYSYIVSDQFGRLNDPVSILEYAKQIKDLINGAGAALIRDFAGIDIGAVQHVSPDGKIVAHAMATASLVTSRERSRGTRVAADPDGPVKLDETEPLLAKALRIARDHEDLAHVLQLLNKPSWVNLYIIHGIMQRVLGASYISTVETTKDELERFTHTASAIARHDPDKYEPPKQPLTHDEARDYIQRHVIAWVHSLPN